MTKKETSLQMTKKAALLQAAKELFGELGYTDTTFKKISERAHVALGLLTHHYGNKERLFLAAGLDVLEHFIAVLRLTTAETTTGKDAVIFYCQAYLNFTIDPSTNWLVLVRCSPYSDMKVSDDRQIISDKFLEVHQILEECLMRGIIDGSIREIPIQTTSQVIISLLVGANRTNVLTPYANTDLYKETLLFVERAIQL